MLYGLNAESEVGSSVSHCISAEKWKYLSEQLVQCVRKKIGFECGWHVMRKVIWYVTKQPISEIFWNIYFFQAAVSALFGSLSFALQKR